MESNVALLEHVNLNINDPSLAFTFFIEGIGCSLNPGKGKEYENVMYVDDNVWLNAGINQFHLPITTRGKGGATTNILRGIIGLAYQDIMEVKQRLENITERLQGTSFSFSTQNDVIDITGPFGNHFRAHNASTISYERDTRGYQLGKASSCLGVPYIEIESPMGSSSGIALFYRHYFDAVVSVDEEKGMVSVCTGGKQQLRFRETPGFQKPTETLFLDQQGYHIALYLNHHEMCMRKLATDGLLWGNPRFTDGDRKCGMTQFRCKNIMNPETKEILLEVEHEVRRADSALCPFQRVKPATLLPIVPLLISSVTSDYERDFSSIRKGENTQQVGYTPLVQYNTL